jgi:Phage capsid family
MGHRSPRQPGPTAGQNVGDAIALAIAAVRTNGFEPDAIVVNPTDYVAMQIAKASTAGTCLLGEPAASPSPTVWSVTVVPTPNLAAGTAIVGQFSSATLFVRESMVISWAEQGRSATGKELFIQNAVRARAEVRVLLAVHVPAAFCEVDLAA